MPFSIREATTLDLPVMVEAYQWLFESPGGTPPDWDEEAALDSIAATIESDSSVFFVAISSIDATLVGICSAYLDLDSVRYGKRCWIEDLAVDPSRRSKGVGRELIAEVRTWALARGATHLELDTGKARTEARRFYEGLNPDRETVAYGWTLSSGGN